MKKIFILFVLLGIVIFVLFHFLSRPAPLAEPASWWSFQSIDTMKYSRDLSRQELTNPSFDLTINQQMSQIAATGATYVAIDTPYDDEFYPILKRWVDGAREYHLHVWFRGNWSGWEGWFNYPKITRAEHIEKTKAFIVNHPDLFEDGDIFTACPECENGGPGDPRVTGDIAGHREFLIDEYQVTKDAFQTIHKQVASNYDSMNSDVAKVVMDKKTTKALGGVVTIDHYVASPQELTSDIKEIAQNSGGKIVLGEFGAPIPDINGQMTDSQQADWIKQALAGLVQENVVVGLNYWTNEGSSTALWNTDGTPKPAVGVIHSFYSPKTISGRIVNEAGEAIPGVYLTIGDRHYFPDAGGYFSLSDSGQKVSVMIQANGYSSAEFTGYEGTNNQIVLKKLQESSWFKVKKFINQIDFKFSL